MMLTEHRGSHTCNEGWQRNSELDVTEAGRWTSTPEMLGEAGGWWEVRKDGRGVRVCAAGMGRGSRGEGDRVRRAPREGSVSIERERPVVVCSLLPASPHRGISAGPRMKQPNFHCRTDCRVLLGFFALQSVSIGSTRKCFHLAVHFQSHGFSECFTTFHNLVLFRTKPNVKPIEFPKNHKSCFLQGSGLRDPCVLAGTTEAQIPAKP